MLQQVGEMMWKLRKSMINKGVKELPSHICIEVENVMHKAEMQLKCRAAVRTFRRQDTLTQMWYLVSWMKNMMNTCFAITLRDLLCFLVHFQPSCLICILCPYGPWEWVCAILPQYSFPKGVQWKLMQVDLIIASHGTWSLLIATYWWCDWYHRLQLSKMQGYHMAGRMVAACQCLSKWRFDGMHKGVISFMV